MSPKKLDLSVRYLGLSLENPLIVGSCGLTGSIEGIEECARAGAGAVVLKSLFEEQISHEVARLSADSAASAWHPEAAEYIEAYGWEDAVGRYLDLIRTAKRSVGIPIIASVHCVSPGSWLEFAKRVADEGADALELNAFVLPSDSRRSGPENEQVYFDLVREVRARVALPIALKIGPFFSSLSQMIERLSRSGVAGLVLFNRFQQPDIDIEKMQLSSAPPFSSPSELALPLRWIALMANVAPCDLAATTGIHDGAGVIKQLLAGANAVQLASALYRHGPEHLGTILGDVRAWMERHEFVSIDAFRGRLAHDPAHNAAAYERVQFMKLSTSIE
ncbi:MAG: dihydroorotate dehydrogenase-like protein [Candidatus Eisenbacteria bacterium]|nr:dihydroorotate dehydrogenase-like protein [Candidatus Eisenbacteria bacterium]